MNNMVSRQQHLECRERYNVLTDRERAELDVIREEDREYQQYLNEKLSVFGTLDTNLEVGTDTE